MSMNIQEVIEAAGYDLSTKEDAIWLLAQRNSLDELMEKAEELLEEDDEL